ncbi:copine-8-like isoform X3 [Dermacentor variabilis]|uniref:copine-8-like isoform X3 n=1 Tax=Dermacentor variabilis TaxID=34621 RepID=UPI003F5C31DB
MTEGIHDKLREMVIDEEGFSSIGSDHKRIILKMGYVVGKESNESKMASPNLNAEQIANIVTRVEEEIGKSPSKGWEHGELGAKRFFAPCLARNALVQFLHTRRLSERAPFGPLCLHHRFCTGFFLWLASNSRLLFRLWCIVNALCGVLTARTGTANHDEMANPTQPFTPAIACTPVTKVEISVSCRHLKQKDLLSKSDPMCVLFMRTCDTDQWLEVGRTETVCDTLDPNFVTKFLVDYYFEERQQLMFKMYDVDSKSVNLQNHDFLGQVASTLGELVAYQGRQVKLQLTGLSGDCGTILLTVEEVLDCKRVIDMQWQGKKLDSKDWFGKSDPFLEFCRVSEDNSYTAVFRTEVVKRNLNPTWRPFTIQMRQLSGGDDDRTLRVACYDWDLDGGMSSSHDLIGEFHTNVRTLSQGPGPANEYKLINKKKQAKKKSYKNSGVVKLISFTVREQATFLDYIQGGFASTYRDGRSYFVLLIITDGVISDMPQTMEAIVQASSLPMSIIIVGVGNADFSAMEVLDGDVIQLNLGGQRAERDIVQFVPFRKFLQSGASWQSNQAQLAKEVLAEIPGQVTAYMSKCNIKPGPIAVPQGPS